jgi:hypothetical protein
MVKRSSTLSNGLASQSIGRWSTKGSNDEEKEGGNQGVTPEGKFGGGGSVYDWQRVKKSVLGNFYSRESSFLFLVFFISSRSRVFLRT